MKGLKYTEVQKLEKTELERNIAANQARLVALEFQKVIGQLDNHAQIRTLRRDIARMRTALRQREVAGQ